MHVLFTGSVKSGSLQRLGVRGFSSDHRVGDRGGPSPRLQKTPNTASMMGPTAKMGYLAVGTALHHGLQDFQIGSVFVRER